jgi:hypothetical protein
MAWSIARGRSDFLFSSRVPPRHLKVNWSLERYSQHFSLPFTMMLRHATALRRALLTTSSGAKNQRVLAHGSRAFHSSAVFADALDMVDTFARRHSKFMRDWRKLKLS